MTQQDADVAPYVVIRIIYILDHDAYTLVDPRAMHSFASKPLLDRFQIEGGGGGGGLYESFPPSRRSVILK